GGVARWRAPRVQHRAVLGRHVAGVDDVLDSDRHAVQRPDGLAGESKLVGPSRLRARVIVIEKRPRLDLDVDFVHPGQARIRVLERTDRALAHQARRLRRRRLVEILAFHHTCNAATKSSPSTDERWCANVGPSGMVKGPGDPFPPRTPTEKAMRL